MDLLPEKNRPRAKVWWLIQAITGGLLIIVLSIHMIAHHFVAEGGLRTYSQVLEYIATPFIFVLEIIFLLLATIHAVLGLRAVLFDLNPKPGMQRIINAVLSIVGIGTAAYGIWLAITLQFMAAQQ